MADDEAFVRSQVLAAIEAVAPHMDVAALRGDRPLREVLDLDSMDWLNVLAGLEQRLGLEIPIADESRLSTIDAIVACAATLPRNRVAGATPGAKGLPRQTYVLQGMPVMVRPMCDDDSALEAEFVQRLSDTSRYCRFMASIRELPAAKLRALTHVDQVRHVALVAVVLVDGAPALAGVARYAVDDTGHACEFALTVDDAWQGSGLAGILMRLLIDVAQGNGLSTMTGLVLRTNDRMLKLGRQLGFECRSDPEDRQTIHLERRL